MKEDVQAYRLGWQSGFCLDRFHCVMGVLVQLESGLSSTCRLVVTAPEPWSSTRVIDELLNGHVLGHILVTVCVANWLHMTESLFGASVISSFFCPLVIKR